MAELTVSDGRGVGTMIAISGRLDATGVDGIETRFTALAAATGKNALVDLSDVTFLASMGIRMLISTARAMHLKKMKMVLFGAQDLVKEVLDHASMNELIPIVADEQQAVERLKS
jgi:anti-anti-sigma factor